MNQWTKLSCKEKKLPFPVNQVLPLEETAEKPTALQRQSPLTHQESPRLWGTLGGGQKNRFAKWWKKKRSRQWLPHLELYWLFPPISLTNSSWFGALIGRLYHLSLFKDLILSVYVCVYVSIHLCICTCTCVTARRVCWVFCSWVLAILCFWKRVLRTELVSSANQDLTVEPAHQSLYCSGRMHGM